MPDVNELLVIKYGKPRDATMLIPGPPSECYLLSGADEVLETVRIAFDERDRYKAALELIRIGEEPDYPGSLATASMLRGIASSTLHPREEK